MPRSHTTSERQSEPDPVGAPPRVTAVIPPHVDRVIALQRAVGNRAVVRLLGHRGGLLRQPAVKPAAAGYARTSPQAELSKDLHDELIRIANANVIIAFIRAQRGASAQVPATLALADVLADPATVKKLNPKPTTRDDLQPAIDLLVFHGVLAGRGPTLTVNIDAQTGDVNTARFDKAKASITSITTDFDRRAAAKDSVDPIGLTSTVDISLAAGAASEKKSDRDAVQAVSDLQSQLAESVVLLAADSSGKPRPPITRVTVDKLPAPTPKASGTNVLLLPIAGSKNPVEMPVDHVAGIESVETGTDPATVKLRQKLTVALERAVKQMHRAQGYRTFAVEVVDFLNRLSARNSHFVGGTYPRHDWGEYSVDAFLSVGEDADGFYQRPPTEQFFDDVNTTALEDTPVSLYGPFQWRAVYNDDRMISAIAAKYGAGRISKAPHHGPAPDKLHVHLDLRPVTLMPDPVTGFSVGAGGRIQVF